MECVYIYIQIFIYTLADQRMTFFHVDSSSTATIAQVVGRYSCALDNDGAQRSRDIGARVSHHGLQFKIDIRDKNMMEGHSQFFDGSQLLSICWMWPKSSFDFHCCRSS